jgi:AraC family transcriptional regulator
MLAAAHTRTQEDPLYGMKRLLRSNVRIPVTRSLTLGPGQFFGDHLVARRVAGASLIEARYPSGLRIEPHTHERPYFCLVVAGGYTEHLSGETRACGSGAAIYHPAGERHADAFERGPARLFMVEPGREWREWGRGFKLPLADRQEWPMGPLQRLLAGIYDEFATNDDASPIMVEGLMLELAGAMKRTLPCSDRVPPRWLERCRERLLAAHGEPIELRWVAAVEGVSGVDLVRGFRRFYRCTPGDYLRRVRVQAACRLLRESRLSLAEIALRCGFSSQSHLCTAFRNATGQTPGGYRRVCANG